MKSYQAVIVIALCLLTDISAAQTTARSFDINLNGDAVRASFAWRLGNPKFLADVGWLHNQDRGNLAHVAVHLVDAASTGDTPLQAGIGLRLIYGDTRPSNLDGGALALGGFARYILPNANRFHIAGELYFGPDVVSFGDMKQYYEIGGRVGYNVMREGDIYLGVRTVKSKFKGRSGDYTYDSGLHVGFQFRF